VLNLRPREFSSHTIGEADRRPDLDRVRSCRPARCSPADSRSSYAIRLQRGLHTAHNCRPAPYNPVGSRSKFARHSRNRMAAAADNNTEHSPSLSRLRQPRRLPREICGGLSFLPRPPPFVGVRSRSSGSPPFMFPICERAYWALARFYHQAALSDRTAVFDFAQ